MEKSTKTKMFRDSVHGYIQIPETIVKHIIDSELFQRLRQIEQTSMRILYPAARHDRFIHSLGVYSLGVHAFNSFQRNVYDSHKDLIEENRMDNKWWVKNRLLFTLACLLHDCAHAPFSHTLEFIYDIPLISNDKLNKLLSDSKYYQKIKSLTKLNYYILDTYNSKEFKKDFLKDSEEVVKGVGAPHEKLSAIMVKKEYEDAIKKISKELIDEDINDCDIEFIARMIIGCPYEEKGNALKSMKNCIISMLNSSSIDVDSLDYIVRDAYNSGIDNWSIDYKRILESFTVTEITVFDDVKVEDLPIDGVWLKDGLFKNIYWKDGSVIGNSTFRSFEQNDTDYIDFIDNDIYEPGTIDKEKNIVKLKQTSKGQLNISLQLTVECYSLIN